MKNPTQNKYNNDSIITRTKSRKIIPNVRV